MITSSVPGAWPTLRVKGGFVIADALRPCWSRVRTLILITAFAPSVHSFLVTKCFSKESLSGGERRLRSFQTLCQGGLDLAAFSESPLCLIHVSMGCEARSMIPAPPQMPCLESLTIRTSASVWLTPETHGGTWDSRLGLRIWGCSNSPGTWGCGLGPAILIEKSVERQPMRQTKAQLLQVMQSSGSRAQWS